MRSDAVPSWEIMTSPSMRERWAPLLTFGATDDLVAKRSGGQLVYLATPYSIQELDGARGQIEIMAASTRLSMATLALRGVTALSPVEMVAGMLEGNSDLDPLDYSFWRNWCQNILAQCKSVYVPMIDGWNSSREVWADVTWALKHNRQVFVEWG